MAEWFVLINALDRTNNFLVTVHMVCIRVLQAKVFGPELCNDPLSVSRTRIGP